ncbi:NADPH:quinone oxidoreductase [Kordiimonas sediminis]|uniref:NADPH:quinone oxidoreductase n=1 Tax=Kordiimonas sediminis TaxID=1735581 RepID=A0A919E9D0_9PROT|nr:NADPH:quinone oxidoreductase family protein [Kordiimonas sediminis]GHF26806.1 NADPH:quinone oxidoreductase [Kordiimonas sediminis]
MKAVLCTELGPAEKLQVMEIDTPTPGKGEVLIDVKAAGLNFPDTLIIEGKYQFKPPLPFTPGGEGSGVVSQVGDGVDHLKVGDRVIFTNNTGAFAEKVVANAAVCIPIPAAMSFEVAAGFTITYATTYHALKQRANIQPGETVLVLGAAGGVGLATVELAKAMGARVIAAASSDEKLAVCKKAGADELINYSTDDLKARMKELGGCDIVYDPVGGDYSETALRTLKPGGRLLVIGFAAGDIPKIPINLCLIKQTSIVGVFWGAWAAAHPAEQRQNMEAMFAMLEKGTIAPLVNDVFSLNQIKDAYACLTERRAKGKVIITP